MPRTTAERESGHIGGIRVHPSDPNVAFVAAIGNGFKPNAERGVFRTKDGGRTFGTPVRIDSGTTLGRVGLTLLADGRALVSWSTHLHRFRMVGDTAVVDVSVRVVEQNAPADSTGRRVTSSVVRGFWVETPGSWRIVRTETLGPDQTSH